MISKIIHQMAPAQVDKWHSFWLPCQQSVKKEFRDFKYELWTHERTDDFVKQEFANFYYWWKNLPLEIIKIDLARLLIIYKYGGIYIDMDVFCYKNFYSELTSDICIVATRSQGTKFDPCENFLFAGVDGHPFFLYSFEESLSKLIQYSKDDITETSNNGDETLPTINVAAVNLICGNVHMSQMYFRYRDRFSIKLLDYATFNQNYLAYDTKFYTKHMSTNIWGKEYLDHIENIDSNYKNLKKIPTKLEEFDFYKQYSHTDFLTVFPNLVSCNFNIFTTDEKKQILNEKFLNNDHLDKLMPCINQYAGELNCGCLKITDQSYTIVNPLSSFSECFQENFIAGIFLPDECPGYLELVLHNSNEFIFGLSNHLVNQGLELSKYCYGIFTIPIAGGSLQIFPSWFKFCIVNKNNDPKTIIMVKIEFDKYL